MSVVEEKVSLMPWRPANRTDGQTRSTQFLERTHNEHNEHNEDI